MTKVFSLLILLSFNLFGQIAQPTDIYSASLAYERSDMAMNLEYIALMQMIDSKTIANIEPEYHREIKKRIIYNQRSWLSYRDSYCELTAMREGNTRAVLFYEINCMYTQTRDRLVYLKLLNGLIVNDTKINLP